MSEEHARLVVEAYAAGYSDSGSPGANSPEGRLLRVCLNAISWADYPPDARIPRDVTLAMPPAVAEVYLNHSDAGVLHDCEDCGYKVPDKHFATCPLCGGRVGYSAYFLRHQKSGR